MARWPSQAGPVVPVLQPRTSLLERARQEPGRKGVHSPIDRERLELAVALFNGEVGLAQAARAMGSTTAAAAWQSLSYALKAGAQAGAVVVALK